MDEEKGFVLRHILMIQLTHSEMKHLISKK